MSAYAGYGTWWQVLHRLAEEVERHSRGAVPDAQVIINGNPDPLHCARELGRHLGQPRFKRFIEEEFEPKTADPANVLYRIANFPFAHFLTLNFDTSNERVHGRLGVPCTSLSTANDDDLLEFIRNLEVPGYGRRALHLHGLYSDPIDRIALTTAGYIRLYHNSKFFNKALWSLVASRQLVFLGYGFNDNAFNRVLTEVVWDLGEDKDPYHFAVIGIWPNEDDAPKRNTLNDTYLIEPVFYELRGTRQDPDFAGFVELVNGIADEIGAGGLVQPAVAQGQQVVEIAAPAEQGDIQRARELGDAILNRFDPGGSDV